MKKVLKIQELDCANCARKVQDKIAALEGVQSVTVNFLAEKILLEIEDGVDFAALLKSIKKAARRVEPDCEISE